MLTHHLTIVQHKFLFISTDRQCVWVDNGLHPQDAAAYSLTPVMAVTLTVEGVGTHYQEIFQRSGSLPLADFLHRAWTNAEALHGLPDILCVDEELLSDFSLGPYISTIHPTGKVPQIKIKAGKRFGSSKAQAQRQAESALPFDADEQLRPPSSVNAILDEINKHMFQYYAWHLMYGMPDYYARRSRIEELNAISPIYPEAQPQGNTPSVDYGAWMAKASNAVPRLGSHQKLTESHPGLWMRRLEIDATQQDGEEEIDDHWDYAPDYIWAKQCPNLCSFIQSLGYSIAGYLPPGVNKESYERFLKGREALLDADLSAVSNTAARCVPLLFPRSPAALRASQDWFVGEREQRCAFEVIPGDSINARYRIFAIDTYEDFAAFIIPTGSKVDVANISRRVYDLNGCLEIGQPAFAALEYWLQNHLSSTGESQSDSILGMLKAILRTLPEWRNA